MIPEKNAVIAITSETKDMGASMQLVWDHILPAMEDVTSKPEDKEATRKLLDRTSQLSLPLSGGATNDASASISGKRSYAFDANKQHAQKISFAFGSEEMQVTLVENEKTTKIKSGHRRWLTADNKRESGSLFSPTGRPNIQSRISSSYYWPEQNKLVLTLKFVETAHADVYTFLFTEGKLEMSFTNSVGIMQNRPDERPAITASLVA